MKPKTLKALKASIAHWEKNATGRFDGVGASCCALCGIFHHKNCVGCPVSEKTGHSYCKYTPYNSTLRTLKRFGFSTEFWAAAQKEVDFLKRLLPKEAGQ